MSQVGEQLRRAKSCSTQIATLSSTEKDAVLVALADDLSNSTEAIVTANQRDMDRARTEGASRAVLDRLLLTPQRVESMCEGIRQVLKLPDPVGEEIASWSRPSGIEIQKVRTPIGVLAIIFEGRPNVTMDSIALCFKSGNCVVLRGSRVALESNRALTSLARSTFDRMGISAEAVQFIDSTDRGEIPALLSNRSLVDAVIPRGGKDLIDFVCETSKVPVIETGAGVCHVYVHADADPEMVGRIVLNAKVQRPSVCNAVETIIVHESFARQHLANLVDVLAASGVEVRGCPRTIEYSPAAVPAQEHDFGCEFLDLILAVKVVAGLDGALAHIQHYGTRHSESIITRDKLVAERFLREVDAAAVYHNCSTRFTDGFEFGYGAEIGISTQKLHARGPMGLVELTTYKYAVRGEGVIRI